MHLEYVNVNHAISILPQKIMMRGVKETSRNGPVVSWPDPVTITTVRPEQRVLLCPRRRANPFLFLLDGLSILSRVNLVEPFARITPRFRQYSDDGVTLRGHYGHRLADQIPEAIQMLREQMNSRRVTMAIWNSNQDLGTESRDIPCNVHVNLRVLNGALDLTVFNRSNDVLWGMLGANIVQFSFLQEYIARSLGLQVGRLHQISTNAHIYTEFGPGKDVLDFTDCTTYPPVIPLDITDLTNDLNMMFLRMVEPGPWEFEIHDSQNTFLQNVVFPMMMAWQQKDLSVLDPEVFPDCDWFHAARMYGVK